jgi:hypothetical protein
MPELGTIQDRDWRIAPDLAKSLNPVALYGRILPMQAMNAARYALDPDSPEVKRWGQFLPIGLTPREAAQQIDSVIAQGVVIDRPALLNWSIPADHPTIKVK